MRKCYATPSTTITQKYIGSFINYPIEISYATLNQYVDNIFIALHGRPGEDGTIQAILEQYNIPYNGSNVLVSKLI